MSSIHDAIAEHMGGDKHEAPKKEIHEIRTRKGKSGGFIHEHHHTAPSHHPMEEHTSKDDDAMAAHMMANMGTPNPGEGQDASAAPPDPSAGAAAPAPTGSGSPVAAAPMGM